MLRTILFLVATLIALPVVAWYYDAPPGPEHWDGIKTLFQAMLAAALLCFAVSELTRNYSQVDKLWSLLPIGYAWYVSYRSGFDARTGLMAALATLWGLRLTFNFARRGGYQWPPGTARRTTAGAFCARIRCWLNACPGWLLTCFSFPSIKTP